MNGANVMFTPQSLFADNVPRVPDRIQLGTVKER
jgi:hypothetical protein